MQFNHHYPDTVKNNKGARRRRYFEQLCIHSTRRRFVSTPWIICKKGGVPINFDSGCTHAVIPFATGFIGRITPVDKCMNGLGTTKNIVGEVTIIRSLRDNFGVIKR